MGLLVNDLSFHGQFADLITFREAIGRLMVMRNIASKFGQTVHCHRSMMNAQVTSTIPMPQAIQSLTLNEKRAFCSWITQNGPFWEDAQNHSSDDWLEYNGNIVTDTAIAEVAWCCLSGIYRELLSITPSNWNISPLSIEWTSEPNAEKKVIDIFNNWDPASFQEKLEDTPTSISSWRQLEDQSLANCPLLVFSPNAFEPLNGHPFVAGAAQRLLFILVILNRFKSSFNSSGERTAEGHEIYQDFFTGVKSEGGRGAMFSDSSDSEKVDFKKEMTFKHPEDSDQEIFCPWHGKVQTPQLRVHFSWPVRSDEPLYVVYVGPKLTKQ